MFVPGRPLRLVSTQSVESLVSPTAGYKSPWGAVTNRLCDLQILKPAEKKQKYVYGGMSTGRPVTPPRKQKKK